MPADLSATKGTAAAQQSDRAFKIAFCLAGAVLATLGLCILAWAPAGLQQLLLLCLCRLAVLTCVSSATYRALARSRRAEAASPPGSGQRLFARAAASASGASPRSSLVQAALCLQLFWLSAELLLGSALLVFYPYLLGPPVDFAPSTAAILSVLPVVCAATMSGCFLFFHRLTSRRRRSGQPAAGGGSAAACCPSDSCGLALECGLAGRSCGLGLAAHQHPPVSLHAAATAAAQQQRAAAAAAGQQQAGAHHRRQCSCGGGLGGSHAGSSCCLHLGGPSSCSTSLDGLVASPSSLSDSDSSFSSCSSGSVCEVATSSSAGSSSYYPTPYGSGLTVLGSPGAPSPTGHVRCQAGAAHAHEAALAAACEILLVEHQLDTMERCLFVHKRLRPIRTRPEDKSKPAAAEKPGLLRELITSSFTFQHNPDIQAQLAGSDGGSSLSFQAVAGMVGMDGL